MFIRDLNQQGQTKIDKINKLLSEEFGMSIKSNYPKKEKLDKIKESVTDEMNGGQSQKRLRTLKESREHILNKYYKLTQKLTNE